MNIQYNALDYAQQLEAAGVPAGQARVHATTLGNVISACLVTPSVLSGVQSELSHQLAETETHLSAELAKAAVQLRGEIDRNAAELRGAIAATEAWLRTEINTVEIRLSGKIEAVEARLSDRIGRLEDSLRTQMHYLKWMNALTLAILVGLIVKSSFV